MAGRKSDFTLPTLDDLFSTQELRDDAKLSKIRDIPLELMWLLLINTALAGSDLVCVFVLAKTPKSSLTLGHYMRKQ